jgi:hypothetical protein
MTGCLEDFVGGQHGAVNYEQSALVFVESSCDSPSSMFSSKTNSFLHVSTMLACSAQPFRPDSVLFSLFYVVDSPEGP